MSSSSYPNTQWNAYGYALKQNQVNFTLIEGQNSDADPAGSTNLKEIQAGTQPGWTSGSGNKIYGYVNGTVTQVATVAPPNGISGNLDPPPAPPACTVSASNTSPTVGNSITLTTNCSNSPTGYTWVGCSSSSASCVATAATPGTASYSVTAVNSGGSSMQASVSVNWKPAAPSAPACTISASNTSPTVGISITVTANCTNNPTSYAWVGCSSSTASCVATAAMEGVVSYSVMASNSGGTSTPAILSVNWHALLAPPPLPPTVNYQGLWWASPAGSESGWGINFAHQGDIIFASWFTYDQTGKGLWLVMTAPKSAPNTYTGTLYTTTGPAFNAVSFNPAEVVPTEVGTGTLTFTDANAGSFAYTVNGVFQTKAITREVFGPLPSCTTATVSLSVATNYQDLWWAAPAGSESGWGINFTHQGDTIFATWFTYDFDHTPMWLVVTAPKTAPGVYSGTLYRTTGPAFNALPFNPANVVATAVGTATFTFSDGNNASFAYTVSGVPQTKAITREVFTTPGTVCH